MNSISPPAPLPTRNAPLYSPNYLSPLPQASSTASSAASPPIPRHHSLVSCPANAAVRAPGQPLTPVMEESSPTASPRRVAVHATLTTLATVDPATVISADAPVLKDTPTAPAPSERHSSSCDDLSLICSEKTDGDVDVAVDALLAAADRARAESCLRQSAQRAAPVISQPTCKTVPADPAYGCYHRPTQNISAASSADSLCGSDVYFLGAHTPTPPDHRSPAHGQRCASPSPPAGSAAHSQRRRNSRSRRSSRSHSLPPLYEAHDEEMPGTAISAPVSPDLNKATTSARPITADNTIMSGGRHGNFRRRVKSEPPQPILPSGVLSQMPHPPASPCVGQPAQPRGGAHRVIHGRSGQSRGRRSSLASSPPRPSLASVAQPGLLARPEPLSTGMHVATTSGVSYI